MSKYKNTPLLSICIPTYNRAHLLESALYSLAPQVKAASPDVELIVSDNCSTDNTQEIVERAREWGPIRYYRNTQNEGAARNILRLTNELASGEFAWILCDDDLVRPDGVGSVLTVLKAYPDVDYIFVNVSPKHHNERHALSGLISGADFPELLPTKARNLEDRYVERWEEMIDPDIDEVFLGSAMCSVFRLSCWMEHQLELDINDEVFSSLDQTYPHAVILAHTMRGRKAYYIGYPHIITFFGKQEWLGYLPLIITVRLQELLDLYRHLGIEKERVERCRQFLLSYSIGSLQAILRDPNTPGRRYFSLCKFLWRNRYHRRQLVGMLFQYWLPQRLLKPILVVVRATRRTLRILGVK